MMPERNGFCLIRQTLSACAVLAGLSAAVLPGSAVAAQAAQPAQSSGTLEGTPPQPAADVASQVAVTVGALGVCEQGVWDQMSQRARLHSQIDLSDAQHVIYKPDSVLEYSCFDRFIRVAANNARYYLDPGILNNVVRYPAEDYLYANFGHTYLGGRAARNTNRPPTHNDYICTAMTAIWQLSKCLDSEEMAGDGPSTLLDFLTGADIRALPGNRCDFADITQFGPVPVPMTAIQSRIPLTLSSDECGNPMPTGVTVNATPKAGENRPATFREYTCPNPVCTYVPPNNNTGIGSCQKI